MTNQNTNINELVDKWLEVRERRRELESLAEQIAAGPELELRSMILMYLDVQGLDGAKVNKGTISRRTTSHMQIENIETVCQHMLNNMNVAAANGKPLADCLLLQQRAHAGNTKESIAEHFKLNDVNKLTDKQVEEQAKLLGMKVVNKSDISFTRSK